MMSVKNVKNVKNEMDERSSRSELEVSGLLAGSVMSAAVCGLLDSLLCDAKVKRMRSDARLLVCASTTCASSAACSGLPKH